MNVLVIECCSCFSCFINWFICNFEYIYIYISQIISLVCKITYSIDGKVYIGYEFCE